MNNRTDDIRDKLAYAQTRLFSLKQELGSVIATEDQVGFVGQKVGEIIGACRECFDYAVRDISDAFLCGKGRNTYFPFSEKVLKSGRLLGLFQSNRAVYDYFAGLIEAIDRGYAYENTIFRFRIIREINNLVNDKKHDRITVAKRRSNSATQVTFPGGAQIKMSPIYRFDGEAPDFSEDLDAEPMIGSHPEIEISYVSEYRLAENNWEISRYCDHAIGVTWRVLDDLYRTANIPRTVTTFNPLESLKSAEQIAYEGFLKRAEHIATKLIVVGFYLAEKEVRQIRFVAKDEEEYSKDGSFLRDLLQEVFRFYVLPNEVNPKIGKLLCENWQKVEQSNFNGRYMELHIEREQSMGLKLPSDSEIIFDKMVWGLGTDFKQPEPDGTQFQFFTPENMARVHLVFPDFTHMYVIGQSFGERPSHIRI